MICRCGNVWSKPEIDNLFFVGLLQPLGAIMPVAEAQGRLIGDYLAGRVRLPSPERMRANMEKERRAMFSRYHDRAPRHTMQVDYGAYFWRLDRVRRQGAAEARKQGYRLPVPARAQAGQPETSSRRATG